MAPDDAERRARRLRQLWDEAFARRVQLGVACDEAFARGDLLLVLETMTEAKATWEALREAVLVEAKRDGASWQDIGNALGLPRQVVWKKYSALI